MAGFLGKGVFDKIDYGGCWHVPPLLTRFGQGRVKSSLFLTFLENAILICTNKHILTILSHRLDKVSNSPGRTVSRMSLLASYGQAYHCSRFDVLTKGNKPWAKSRSPPRALYLHTHTQTHISKRTRLCFPKEWERSSIQERKLEADMLSPTICLPRWRVCISFVTGLSGQVLFVCCFVFFDVRACD